MLWSCFDVGNYRSFLRGPFRIVIPGSSWPLPISTTNTHMASSATPPHESLIRLAKSGPRPRPLVCYLNEHGRVEKRHAHGKLVLEGRGPRKPYMWKWRIRKGATGEYYTSEPEVTQQKSPVIRPHQSKISLKNGGAKLLVLTSSVASVCVCGCVQWCCSHESHYYLSPVACWCSQSKMFLFTQAPKSLVFRELRLPRRKFFVTMLKPWILRL